MRPRSFFDVWIALLRQSNRATDAEGRWSLTTSFFPALRTIVLVSAGVSAGFVGPNVAADDSAIHKLPAWILPTAGGMFAFGVATFFIAWDFAFRNRVLTTPQIGLELHQRRYGRSGAMWWNLAVTNVGHASKIPSVYGEILMFEQLSGITSPSGVFEFPESGHRLPWSWFTGQGQISLSVSDNHPELNLLTVKAEDSLTFSIPGPKIPNTKDPHFLEHYPEGRYRMLVRVGSLEGGFTSTEQWITIDYRGGFELRLEFSPQSTPETSDGERELSPEEHPDK